MKTVLIFLVFTCSFLVLGQKDLISNGGFEETTGCPGPSMYLKNVPYWDVIDRHAGTPDQFYGSCEYNGIVNRMAPGQTPYEGSGYVGSFCYGSNLREYITIKFNRPMVKDSTYEMTFYVLPATGYGQAIDSYGVHFSSDKVAGVSKKSLAPLTLEEHIGNKQDGLIEDTVTWTKIIGRYKAKGGENYATFGNFRQDASTKSRTIKENCIRSDRSYILLDGVSLTPVDTLICNLHNDTRNLVVKKDVVLKTRQISVDLWDHMKSDGDTINVWIDDSLALENFPLSNRIQTIELELKQGTHYFKIYAVNVGRVPPNTTTVRIRERGNTFLFTLNSDYETTECLKIKVP